MKTLRKVTLSLILISFVILGGITSCKCSHESKQKTDIPIINAQADSFSFPGIEYLLPSPSDVLQTLFSEDITYTQNLTAPVGIEKKAVISQYQALILGVYITDLSYNVLFKNHQASSSYLASIRELSESVGIGSLLYNEYFKRVESNTTNIDSMDAIFYDFSQNAFLTIGNSGNNEMLSLVAMGSSIEIMYLSYKSLAFETISQAVLPNFVGQRVIFENYYKNFVEYNKKKPDLKDFLTDLEAIYNLFEKNVAEKTESTITKLKDSHFAIKDKVTYTHSELGIKELGDKIISVRNKLIEMHYQQH